MAKILLEDFVTSLDHLPIRLKEVMTDMREKDVAFHEQRSTTSKRQSHYFRAERKNPKMDDTELNPGAVKADYLRALDIINEKIEMGAAAFDAIDKQVKRLEADTRKLEQEMEEEKQREKGITAEAQAAVDKRSQKRKADAAAVGTPPPSDKATPGRKRKQAEVEKEVIDGPIDPSEPLYCVCQQVSFGEMVACDNNLCPYEWFHYSCVGLTTPPKGKWFCSSCLAKRRKLISTDLK